MTPKISIIVPVYNVEKYLKRCIDSILTQTFTDFECILIDDGSPDNCPAICDEYAKADKRIKVIHQENKGVSAARNAGLDTAKGEWIGFVDSDDWIEPNMYEILYEDAIHFNVDVCVCNFCYKNENLKNPCMLSNAEAKRLMFTENGIGGFSVLRIIKRSVIKNLRYDSNLSYFEDTKFFYNLFDNCKSIYWNKQPLYHYENNLTSVTNRFGMTKDVEKAFSFLFDIEKKEKNEIIRNSISISISIFSKNIIIQYFKHQDFHNSNVKILQNNIKKRIIKLVFSKSASLKMKIIVLISMNTILLKIYLKIRGEMK